MIGRLFVAFSVAGCLLGAAPAMAEVELSYGFAATTNYVDAYETFDGPPALQGYVEGGYGPFYVGLWASTLDPDDTNEIEFDLSVGALRTIGEVEFNLSYTRFIYDDSGDCCGEFGLAAEFAVSESLILVTNVEYDPQEEGSLWTEVDAAFAIDDQWAVSGALGADTGDFEPELGREVEWDLGVTRSVGESGWIDVRFYDSNQEHWTWALSAGMDF